MINNQIMACDFVMKWARKKYGVWFQKIEYQNGKHFYLRPSDLSKPSFYLVFKREWFMLFDKMFDVFVRENPDLKGVGESLNEEALFRAIRFNVDYLCFIHPDGEIFVISPLLFFKFASKYELVREQKRTNFYKTSDGTCDIRSVNEVTYSVPKVLLTKMESDLR